MFVALAVGALSVTAVAGPTSSAFAQAGTTLTGAGSTLVQPLEAKWAADFQSQNGTQITYGAVGSGTGIQQITARTVDFGASDAPLTAAQAAACNGCVQVPWALTATGVAYHVNGLSKLQLNSNVLTQIFQGRISMWNDKRIKAINPKVKLPATKITPVFRSDGSGDTYAFTDFLSRTSPAWKSRIGTGTQVNFPVGQGGKGNDGVTAIVSSTDGSIAYISAAYIIAHGLKAAALQNRAGNYELPNLKNISAAAATLKKVPANNEMHIVAPPKSAKTAYPLSTFTYAILPKASPKAALLNKFVTYAMTTGQKFGAALDFAPIPAIVLKAAKSTLTQVK